MSKTINLFVSHKGEDEKKIDAFKKLMEKKGYDFRDSSIRESEPNRAKNENYIKSEILAPAIKWAGTLVVLIGKDTHKSDWVNWEINYAMEHGKRIIGVFLNGEADAKLPEALKEFGDAYEIASPDQEALMKYFRETCDEHGIVHDREELFRFMREYKNKTIGTQMTIFDYS